MLPTVGKDAPTAYLGNDGFYVLFLTLAALALRIPRSSRSKLGYALWLIHQDEDAAAAVGMDTTRDQAAVFARCPALSRGWSDRHTPSNRRRSIPSGCLIVGITVLMVVMVVIGGSGTVIGRLIGAVALQFLSERSRQNDLNVTLTAALGAIIILAVILLPQGSANYVREARTSGQILSLLNVRRYRL